MIILLFKNGVKIKITQEDADFFGEQLKKEPAVKGVVVNRGNRTTLYIDFSQVAAIYSNENII